MFKLITITALALLISVPAMAQNAPNNTRASSNAFKKLTQAECTADKGAMWKPAETWVRKEDGKERVTQARCSFDAKAAKVIVAKMIAR